MAIQELDQAEMYDAQYSLLQYLQQINHPAYSGKKITRVGELDPNELNAEENVVCFISDAGFQRNTAETTPEYMEYVHILNQGIISIAHQNGIVEHLVVRGTRTEVLPSGKPVVVGTRQ